MLSFCIMQIGVGALLGAIAGRIVDGSYSKQLEYGRWHPMNQAGSAKQLASVLATASGVPLSNKALMQHPNAAPPGEDPQLQSAKAQIPGITQVKP